MTSRFSSNTDHNFFFLFQLKQSAVKMWLCFYRFIIAGHLRKAVLQESVGIFDFATVLGLSLEEVIVYFKKYLSNFLLKAKYLFYQRRSNISMLKLKGKNLIFVLLWLVGSTFLNVCSMWIPWYFGTSAILCIVFVKSGIINHIFQP